MLLVAQDLRIAHVTLHESVGAALKQLSPELVVAAAQAVGATAKRLGGADQVRARIAAEIIPAVKTAPSARGRSRSQG